MPQRKIGGYFQLAKKLAITSDYGNFRHGAVLVKGSAIIGVGVNNEKYSSVGAKYRSESKGISTYHAEISAMLNLPRSMTKGATIYVARASKKDGAWRLSKPCDMCHALMEERGIYQVFYSIDGDNIGTYKL
jgi:deoxycytidylate deaminase